MVIRFSLVFFMYTIYSFNLNLLTLALTLSDVQYLVIELVLATKLKNDMVLEFGFAESQVDGIALYNQDLCGGSQLLS